MTVRAPGGIAARIYISNGMGAVIVDPRFEMIAELTYQSADYGGAQDRIEITAQSGFGSVSLVCY